MYAITKHDAVKPQKASSAPDVDISPVVNGLYFVRCTCLSMSKSQKSFIIHPADLAARAPIENKEALYKVSIEGVAAIESPQKQGNSKSIVPICLSILIKRK